MKQLVAKAGEDNYTSWSVLGVDVCRRAWMSIHCVGRFDVIFFFACWKLLWSWVLGAPQWGWLWNSR